MEVKSLAGRNPTQPAREMRTLGSFTFRDKNLEIINGRVTVDPHYKSASYRFCSIKLHTCVPCALTSSSLLHGYVQPSSLEHARIWLTSLLFLNNTHGRWRLLVYFLTVFVSVLKHPLHIFRFWAIKWKLYWFFYPILLHYKWTLALTVVPLLR